MVPPISRRALGRSRCSRVKRSDPVEARARGHRRERARSAGRGPAPRPDRSVAVFRGGEPVGCGLVRLDDTDAVGGVGEHQPLGLEGAEQVPQSAGVIGLMFATVEPSGHVVAGDLPQRCCSGRRSRPGTVGCPRPAGRRWCAEDEPAAAGCPHAARRSRPAGPGGPRRRPGRRSKRRRPLAENGDPMPPL